MKPKSNKYRENYSMYFELKIEMGQDYGVTKWPDLPEGVHAFQTGDFISINIPQPIEFIVDNTAENPPIDLASIFMPVFSNKLIEAFRKASVDNFQTFSAVLKNPITGEQWRDYKVVNVLGKIACVDLNNSEYETMLGIGYEFSKLVLDNTKAKGALFFRLLESQDKIIVHNDVLDYMYTDDDDPIFEGVDFDPIESKPKVEN